MTTEIPGQDRGVVGIARLPRLAAQGESQEATQAMNVQAVGKDTAESVAGGFTVFAAMPFHASFDDVFFVAIQSAARAVGGRAVRVDQVMQGEDAVAVTKEQLQLCRVVVADVSTAAADVLYELGFAHALGKPSVQICRTPYDELPFMVRNRETLLYQAGQTYLLGQQLAIYLRNVLSGH